MKIISLASQHAGYACATGNYISKYFYNDKKSREFFDLITVSMKSINEVLMSKNIEFEDKEVPYYRVPNSTDNIIVNFKNFNSMTSYHDLYNMSNESINYYINFYTKLQHDLIDNIKTENKIFFLRTVKDQNDLQEDDIHIFYNTIFNINPNLQFYFIILTDTNINISENLLNKNNFILFNFSDYLDSNKKYNDNIYVRILDDYESDALQQKIKLL